MIMHQLIASRHVFVRLGRKRLGPVSLHFIDFVSGGLMKKLLRGIMT